MPAVYVPPGGSANYPALQTSTHTDQISLNVAPHADTTAQTFFVSPHPVHRDGASISLTTDHSPEASR